MVAPRPVIGGAIGIMIAEPHWSPLAQHLGVTPAAILHVDDLGMCHGANGAFLSLVARGLVTCG
jgi:hypothetical protein